MQTEKGERYRQKRERGTDREAGLTCQLQYCVFRNFPDYYYPLKQTIPGSGASVEFIMMDTILLCGNSGDDRLHMQPRGPDNIHAARKQWDFVEKSLKKST